jgi:hypothetical protein
MTVMTTMITEGDRLEPALVFIRYDRGEARLSSLAMQDEKNDHPKTGDTEKDGSLSPNHLSTLEAIGGNSL